MTFNIKSRFALAVSENALARPIGRRHGTTGFWVASLRRVQNERLVRMAYMPEHRFVFEAEIDADLTHVMTLTRIDEYIEHEYLKRLNSKEVLSSDGVRNEIVRCIEQGRIVVAFRNAHAFDGATEHTGQNPVWYTEDD